MFLSKRSNGIYYIYYEVPDGKRIKVSTKARTKREALIFLSSFKQDTLKQQKKINEIHLHAFRHEFLKHSEAVHTPKTTKTFITTFKYLEEFLGNKLINEISSREVMEFIVYRIKNPSVYQARKDLINLSSAFNWGIQKEFLISNPCNTVKRLKPPQKLPVFFSETEFDKLITVIKDEEFKAIVVLAVNTGLRQMELLNLRWNQIDLKNKNILLDNQTHITKSKKIRTLPLNKKTIETIVGLNQKNSHDFVFEFPGITNRWKFIQNNFRKYVKLAELNHKLNFHSLRHTFASWLVQRGVSIYEVSKLLGHSDIKITQIYAHLREDDLKRAVDLL